MPKVLKIALAVGLAVFVFVERAPIGRALGRTRASFRSTADHATGKTSVDLGQVAKRQVVQNTLKSAIGGYQGLHGEAPRSLDQLVDDGLLQRADLVDEWGRQLQVEPRPHGIAIRSAGADGRIGTQDDWVLSR